MVFLQNHYESFGYMSNTKFYSVFYNDFTIGSIITVKGLTLRKCERFHINLLYGQSIKADVALHVNPRLIERFIARNTKEDGLWNENEERQSETKFNLKPDYFFNIQILFTENEFMIFVQDEHFCNFQYRFPKTRPIDAIEICGDVENINVDVNKINSIDFRTPIPLNNSVDFDDYKDGPMLFSLSQNFAIGHILHINGRIKMLPVRFSINLQQSARQWPHPYVAFHFNPRYLSSDNISNDVIIQNTLLKNGWGREERLAMVRALTPGRVFHLSIQCFEGGFKLWLNYMYWSTFAHRINPTIIDTLRIQGDVKILNILEES